MSATAFAALRKLVRPSGSGGALRVLRQRIAPSAPARHRTGESAFAMFVSPVLALLFSRPHARYQLVPEEVRRAPIFA